MDTFPHLNELEGVKNQTLNETNEHQWTLTLTAVCALVISILGFLGNLLTILALPHTRKLRTAATWFVVNLAVIEMIFCITILPMSATNLFYRRYTHESLFDTNGCKLFVFLRYVMIQAELLSISGIAINRCVLIAVPKKYPAVFSTKKTTLFIIGIWLTSALLMVLPLFDLYGSFSYNENTQECDFAEDSKDARKVYLALGFLIPCIIIIISYSYIFYKSRESTKRIQALTAESASAGEIVRPATGLRNRDMRIARTIAVLFLVFIICCTPVTVAHYYGSQGQIPTLLLLLHPLYWLQYCLNGVIYVFMNSQYREAYISYISHWWPRFQLLTSRFYVTDEETSISLPVSRQSGNSGKKISVTRSPKGGESPLPSPGITPVSKKRNMGSNKSLSGSRKTPSMDALDAVNTPKEANFVGSYKAIKFPSLKLHQHKSKC